MAMSGDYARLWSAIRELMGSGGKRIRSRIVVLSYQMFGGDDVQSIVPVAAAHELLHLGMLIHDDIIDRDYVRYGVEKILDFGELIKKHSEDNNWVIYDMTEYIYEQLRLLRGEDGAYDDVKLREQLDSVITS